MDSEKYLLRRTSSAKSAAQRKTSSLITATTRILFAGCFAVDAIQVLGKCCTVRNCSSRLSNICAAVRVACWWQLRTALAPIPWRAGILSACTFTKRLRTAYRLSNQRPCGGKAKALNLPAIRMRLSNFGASYAPNAFSACFSGLSSVIFSLPKISSSLLKVSPRPSV